MNDASDLTDGQAARMNAAESVEHHATPTATSAHPADPRTTRAIAEASYWGEAEARHGDLVRVVSERVASSTCIVCELTFRNTGAAAAHARSARHPVDVQYRSRFTYVPVERVLGDE